MNLTLQLKALQSWSYISYSATLKEHSHNLQGTASLKLKNEIDTTWLKTKAGKVNQEHLECMKPTF